MKEPALAIPQIPNSAAHFIMGSVLFINNIFFFFYQIIFIMDLVALTFEH